METTCLDDISASAIICLEDYKSLWKRYESCVRRTRPEDESSSDEEAYQSARQPWRESREAAKEMRRELRLFEERLSASGDACTATEDQTGKPRALNHRDEVRSLAAKCAWCCKSASPPNHRTRKEVSYPVSPCLCW
eukprot:scaffold47_cov258-Pinguiococcus_pyrenoidosus.AAC.103